MSATQNWHGSKRLLVEKSYTDIARETPSPRDTCRDDKPVEADERNAQHTEESTGDDQDKRPKNGRGKKHVNE